MILGERDSLQAFSAHTCQMGALDWACAAVSGALRPGETIRRLIIAPSHDSSDANWQCGLAPGGPHRGPHFDRNDTGRHATPGSVIFPLSFGLPSGLGAPLWFAKVDVEGSNPFSRSSR